MSERPCQTVINFHIPKTAGTSLRSALIQTHGSDRVAFMLPDRSLVTTSELPVSTERLDRIRRVARKMHMLPLFSSAVRTLNDGRAYDAFELRDLHSRDIAVATGHFMPQDITPEVMDLPRSTVVREPLQRAWSHFMHWREARGGMWWHDGTVPYADSVSFACFVADPQMQNYQTRRLGGLTFDIIGRTDMMPCYLEAMGADPSQAVMRLNPGRASMPTLDPGLVRDFMATNVADYTLFESAAQPD